jgi:hypothetical protein
MDLRDKIALLMLLMPIGIVVFLASFYVLEIIGLHAGLLTLHLLGPIPAAEGLGLITILVVSTFASIFVMWFSFQFAIKRLR